MEKKTIKTKSPAPSVAVIIPYYNGSAYIERAVKSVLSQTVPAKEFIIVNDGSNETETAFLHEMARRYDVRVLDKENGGQGSARNAGVAASMSDYICFLDQDDFYLKTHIQTLAEAIPDNDPYFGWAYGDLVEADGDGNVIRTSMVREHGVHPKTHIIDLLRNDMFILPSASLISRIAFEDVGGFDSQFMGYEDDDLFMRLFRRNYTNIFVPKSVTVWCIHTNSTSYSIRMSRSRLRYFKKLVAAFPDDTIKHRFFMQDVFVPRFHIQFINEVMTAVLDERSKLAVHRQELIEIFDEYAEIVCSSPTVSKSLRRQILMRQKLISANSPALINAGLAGVRALRRVKEVLRR
ncbi:glycosyltransferase family 2 protein [Rhizobium rhizogenes]|uniref:glycosyltransferase family 2 protein n=1 Tax=Rhizobium rhizogenes TaxID=359 RepID=UPI00191E168C|nr:glycosyltransferase family A protein [Rhizobium rhizogenes]